MSQPEQQPIIAEEPVIDYGQSTVAHPLPYHFADGLYVIPAHMVSYFGGPNKVRETFGEPCEFTWAEFAQAYSNVNSGEMLNQLQGQIISQHFRRLNGKLW
jgi:hypothetical protein